MDMKANCRNVIRRPVRSELSVQCRLEYVEMAYHCLAHSYFEQVSLVLRLMNGGVKSPQTL